MRILFVVKEFLPKPTPPGICVGMLQSVLMDKGVYSDVLMQGDRDGLFSTGSFGNVYSIKSSGVIFDKTHRDRASNLLSKAGGLLSWPVDRVQLQKYVQYIADLDRTNSYDAIIGVCLPVTTAFAAVHFPNGYVYELDSITNNPELSRGIRRLLRFRLLAMERRLFEKANHIFFLRNNAQYYQHKRYSDFRGKMTQVDVPLMLKGQYSGSRLNENERIEMVYMGGLFREYRSPEYLLKLLAGLPDREAYTCRFFSRGDCEEMIEKASNENASLLKCGYVEHHIVNEAIRRADVLISIGNSLRGQDRSLPSKVIEYMATGKAVVHISGGANDSAIDYLQRYGNALIIEPEGRFGDNLERLWKFMEAARQRVIPFEEVSEKFAMNTPEFTADAIIRQVKGKDLPS